MNRTEAWQKRFRTRIGIGAVAGGLALTMVMAPQLAFAQDESPTGEQVAAANTEHGPGPGGNNEFLAEALGISEEELGAAYEAAHAAGEESDSDRRTLLANELGISVDELDAAQDIAFESALDQAVEDGKLTEEEAELKQAEHDLADYIDRLALLADVLGITVEELESARDEGVKLPDLLEELGVAQETLNEDLETAYEEAVAQAVEDEIISQEQADEILSEETRPHGGQPRELQGQDDRGQDEREQDGRRGPGPDRADADYQSDESDEGDTSADDGAGDDVGDDAAEAASTDSDDDSGNGESGRPTDDGSRPQRGPGPRQGGGRG